MISAIGISTVDHIMVIDGFKGAEGSYGCNAYHADGGGMAATALCTASKLGSSCKLFSRIGDDVNGQFILDRLKKFNIDTSGVVTVSGKNSIVCVILVNSRSGEKQFFFERTFHVFEDYIDFDTSRLNGTDILLVDGFWMEAALEGAVWASKNGVTIVADINKKYVGLEDLLPLIDYFIIPEFFAREITGERTISDILRSLSDMISGIPVITKGSEGGSYFVENEIRNYRAFPVQCVDTTGAGDAFHGAFCHFLSKGLSIDRCLELASAVGAMNCRSMGGRESLPTIEELSIFLKEHGSESELTYNIT